MARFHRAGERHGLHRVAGMPGSSSQNRVSDDFSDASIGGATPHQDCVSMHEPVDDQQSYFQVIKQDRTVPRLISCWPRLCRKCEPRRVSRKRPRLKTTTVRKSGPLTVTIQRIA
jgi:hypothetical protein